MEERAGVQSTIRDGQVRDEDPDASDLSARGGSMMGVVAQSRLRTGKTVVNRPAAASRSTTYPTLTALAIRALSAVVRVGQFG